MNLWPQEKPRHGDGDVDLAVRSAMSLAVPTRFDNLLAGAFPRWAERRLAARQELGYRRAMLAFAGYSAASPSYERPSYFGPMRSEDAELPGYTRFVLINEARNLFREFALIRAGVTGIAHRVGYICPRFDTSDENWNAEAQAQWNDSEDGLDCRARMTFAEMQTQNIISCYVDGDIGYRYVRGRSLGNDVGGDEVFDLNLQPVEADLIAEEQRTGINIDDWSPLGGVVWDPRTGTVSGYKVGRRGVGGQLIEVEDVPASEFNLLFRRQRVDQLRGVPLLAPVINPAKDLDKYLSATRVQANIAAMFGVVIKRDAAGLQQTKQTALASSGDYRTQQLRTGLMTWLKPGESIETFRPDVPASQFDSYAKFSARIIAIGLGTTYEMLMHDFSGMSYSAAKTNLLTEHLLIAGWHRWQTRFFVRPVVSLWLSKRMASGLLDENPEAYDRIHFQTPASVGIDPSQQAEADKTLIAAGLDTFADYYGRLGKDEKHQLRKRAKEAAFIRKLADEFGVEPDEISSVLPPGVLGASARSQQPSVVV